EDGIRDATVTGADVCSSDLQEVFLMFERIRSPDTIVLNQKKDFLIRLLVSPLRQPQRSRCLRDLKRCIGWENPTIELRHRPVPLFGIGLNTKAHILCGSGYLTATPIARAH